MWSGNPLFWGKTSPILFPIVGALRDDSYSFKGKKYSLPRHGFARDMEFNLQQISTSEILFTLHHSDETLAKYPFEFNLGIRYQLTGNSLTCGYEVYNPGEEPLLFSIGGHPAFAVPLYENEDYQDYFLEFNRDTRLQNHKIVNNLISEETNSIVLKDQQLALEHDLFKDDALVFKNLDSDRISILNTRNAHGLHFNFKDFPYFGIWAAGNADFVCLEPWCGIADGIEHHGQLEEKEGIIHLGQETSWKRKWQIDIF
jgi:galactose mutarotase-like enzyme